MYTQLNKKSSWAESADTVLRDGELGYDSKEKVLKVGNGTDRWADLTPAVSLSLTDGYGGDISIINGAPALGRDVAAVVKFQGEVLAQLSASQQATLLTRGETMQDSIEITTAAPIPFYDGKIIIE